MFSFHKPKIYRSNLGCCICKAKSSSSRFTDSKKYENEFEQCFRIDERRSGEICNACVLLVKRWKKLSPENRLTKHWHHVVDARAGPGTKLTGNRRLNAPANNANNLHYRQESSHGASNSSASKQNPRPSNQDSNVLPLTSCQTNNQSNQSNCHSSSIGPRRRNSFSKARAIDNNVTTFTFGESPSATTRRSYMSLESGYSSSSVFSSPGVSKPQSALNSSAFETVIKRFRQRRQQQQLEAQRRQFVRQNRMQQQCQQPSTVMANNSSINIEKKSTLETLPTIETKTPHHSHLVPPTTTEQPETNPIQPSKRLKRSSESIGSITVDGLRVSSLLDSSIWRKEKICCGIIFRGLHNEVALFPKLLKPCQCRLGKMSQARKEQDNLLAADCPRVASPPPRTTKSGSISSCNSATSGTGSMDQPADEEQHELQQSPKVGKDNQAMTLTERRKCNLRQLDCNASDLSSKVAIETDTHEDAKQTTIKRRPRNHPNQSPSDKRTSHGNRKACLETDSTSSSSALSSSSASKVSKTTQELHSPAASSASSSGTLWSRRLMLVADDEDESTTVDDEEDKDEDEDGSNTDAASDLLNDLDSRQLLDSTN